MIQASYFSKVFRFNFKARTSRGLMQDKTSWFVRLADEQLPDVFGIGESGPLPGLSADDSPEFEQQLSRIVDLVNEKPLQSIDDIYRVVPPELPSIRFAFETAWLDLQNGGNRVIYDNDFVRGKGIPINGLIWMGDVDFMMEQINQKISSGFRTIKMKVGGLDFERECDILAYIRQRYYREDITLRLDANGAFKPEDALYKLKELSAFNIHSIEQPVKPGLEVMEELCRKSPIPIAFDEELIGIHEAGQKVKLLEKLKPQYIVLKPTLHGGIQGTAEWIRIAESAHAGWWITSALESSIGLNAICQFTAQYNPTLPQGLGTGAIYENNFDAPLRVRNGHIEYDQAENWVLRR